MNEFTSETCAARDGCQISFGRAGSEDPERPRLVLIPALAMNRDFWNEVAAAFGDTAAILGIDCRGAGGSDKPPGPYDVAQFADDVADVLDAIEWNDAVVAGASMGGCISLGFAAAYPQRTRGLGLIDTTAWYGEGAPAAWAGRAAKAAEGGMAALVSFQRERWFSEAFRNAQPQKVQQAVDIFTGNDVQAYVATCHMLGACDLRSTLGNISVPTSILVGEEDYATPIAMAETLHAEITDSTMRVLAGVRHFTPLEIPEVIAAELGSLLERC